MYLWAFICKPEPYYAFCVSKCSLPLLRLRLFLSADGVHLAADPERVAGRQIVVGWFMAHGLNENFRQFLV